MCRLRIGWAGFLVGLPFVDCAFPFSCWLQAVSPIMHPHQHTRVPSPALPKFRTIHTHRFTHPHTQSRSATLTLNTSTYAFIHSLTHLLAHSPIPFTLPITHSLTNSSHSHSHVQAVVRRTISILRHMLLAGTCPLCHPQSSAPRLAWQYKSCRRSTQQVVV